MRSTVCTMEPWNQCLGNRIHGIPGAGGTKELGDGSRGSRVPLIGHYVYKTEDVPSLRTVFSRHCHCSEIRSLATLAQHSTYYNKTSLVSSLVRQVSTLQDRNRAFIGGLRYLVLRVTVFVTTFPSLCGPMAYS